MITYDINFPIFTPAALVAATGGVTTGSVLSVIWFPGTNRSHILVEVDIQGQGVASANSLFGIFRTITTAAVGALTTVITAQPNVSLSTNPVFSGSAGQGSFATTQPTLAAAPLRNLAANANGQRYYWRANPNLDNAIDVPGTATALLNGIAIVQIGGTGVIAASGRIQIKEI
jgi:hypothetical protein